MIDRNSIVIRPLSWEEKQRPIWDPHAQGGFSMLSYYKATTEIGTYYIFGSKLTFHVVNAATEYGDDVESFDTTGYTHEQILELADEDYKDRVMKVLSSLMFIGG